MGLIPSCEEKEEHCKEDKLNFVSVSEIPITVPEYNVTGLSAKDYKEMNEYISLGNVTYGTAFIKQSWFELAKNWIRDGIADGHNR